MAKHPSRGISSVNEERVEGIGWTSMGSGKVRYFFLFYFPHFIFESFYFCHFILFYFVSNSNKPFNVVHLRKYCC
jgi:hypothetical protein